MSRGCRARDPATRRFGPIESTRSHTEQALILTATRLEALTAAHILGRYRVVRVGLACDRWKPDATDRAIVVCGLAGGLTEGEGPGTVLVPDTVALEDGRRFSLDPEMTLALSAAAERLGYAVDRGDMLTSKAIVTGRSRDRWAGEGFAGVDMETGMLAAQGRRLATVRVVLDTPAHPISELWSSPPRALLRPALVGQLLWMARHAPPFALRAARVIASAGL